MRLLPTSEGNKVALLLAGLVFFVAGICYGQSLGEVARQQRQKQQAKDKDKDTHAPRRVITNDEIPERPESSSDPSSMDDEARPWQTSPVATGGSKKTAEQWKAEIQAQKNDIAALQAQLDRLKASIRFVQANLYVNGAEYNQLQLRKQQQAERLQKQLDEMKQKLESTQEAARKAGFGNAVYDP